MHPSHSDPSPFSGSSETLRARLLKCAEMLRRHRLDLFRADQAHIDGHMLTCDDLEHHGCNIVQSVTFMLEAAAQIASSPVGTERELLNELAAMDPYMYVSQAHLGGEWSDMKPETCLFCDQLPHKDGCLWQRAKALAASPGDAAAQIASSAQPVEISSRRPSEDDINRLEKAAWDAKVDHALVWYRDQIDQLRERLREADRAAKQHSDPSPFSGSLIAEIRKRWGYDRSDFDWSLYGSALRGEQAVKDIRALLEAVAQIASSSQPVEREMPKPTCCRITDPCSEACVDDWLAWEQAAADVPNQPQPVQPGTLGVPLGRRREPTARDFADPRFDVLWELIKRVDVDFRNGLFSGATGNDVCAVLDALDAAASRPLPGGVTAPTKEKEEGLLRLSKPAESHGTCASSAQWRPIETAPKDGTAVVVRFRNDIHEPEVARFVDGHWRTSDTAALWPPHFWMPLQPLPSAEAPSADARAAGRGTEWGLANVYTLARRRLRKLPEGHSEREWWQHVIRISEEAGVKQPGVLRHSVPTEITDGARAAGRGDELPGEGELPTRRQLESCHARVVALEAQLAETQAALNSQPVPSGSGPSLSDSEQDALDNITAYLEAQAENPTPATWACIAAWLSKRTGKQIADMAPPLGREPSGSGPEALRALILEWRTNPQPYTFDCSTRDDGWMDGRQDCADELDRLLAGGSIPPPIDQNNSKS